MIECTSLSRKFSSLHSSLCRSIPRYYMMECDECAVFSHRFGELTSSLKTVLAQSTIPLYCTPPLPIVTSLVLTVSMGIMMLTVAADPMQPMIVFSRSVG